MKYSPLQQSIHFFIWKMSFSPELLQNKLEFQEDLLQNFAIMLCEFLPNFSVALCCEQFPYTKFYPLNKKNQPKWRKIHNVEVEMEKLLLYISFNKNQICQELKFLLFALYYFNYVSTKNENHLLQDQLLSKATKEILCRRSLFIFLQIKQIRIFGFFWTKRLAENFCNNAVQTPAKFLGCTLLRMISINKVLPSEQEELAKMTMPERIYNSHYGNGVPAMFTS